VARKKRTKISSRRDVPEENLDSRTWRDRKGKGEKAAGNIWDRQPFKNAWKMGHRITRGVTEEKGGVGQKKLSPPPPANLRNPRRVNGVSVLKQTRGKE